MSDKCIHTLGTCLFVLVFFLFFHVGRYNYVISVPKLHQLEFLEGNGRTVRVIKEVATTWEEVGLSLHFEASDISRIERDNHQQSVQASRVVFSEWLEGRGRQPTTWGTLIKALKEAGLQTVANDLERILR